MQMGMQPCARMRMCRWRAVPPCRGPRGWVPICQAVAPLLWWCLASIIPQPAAAAALTLKGTQARGPSTRCTRAACDSMVSCECSITLESALAPAAATLQLQ